MTTGFTAGAFDLLHAGHYIFLRKCKTQCDFLIVGLQVDPSRERKEKNKPIQSVLERRIQLKGCRFVNEVVVYETEEDLEVILRNMDIDIRFLGSEYITEKMKITAEDAVPIVYIPRSHSYSSSELRKRIKNDNHKNSSKD